MVMMVANWERIANVRFLFAFFVVFYIVLLQMSCGIASGAIQSIQCPSGSPLRNESLYSKLETQFSSFFDNEL